MSEPVNLVKRDFGKTVAGAMFLAAAVLLWGGWMLLPHHLGTYFVPEDFPAVHGHLHLWLWMFRFYLFGMVMTAMAFVALATTVEKSEARVLVWPGLLIAAGGFLVSALAAAFYYHFGVWGSIEMAGKPAETVQAFVQSLRIDTEYVTCLVRFGRVFSGLGLAVGAVGLMRGQVLPRWNCGVAVVLGIGAMALTMALPDRLSLFQPIFHVEALWLAATGVVLLLPGSSPADMIEVSRRGTSHEPSHPSPRPSPL
jgi:hypothetical protein